VRSKLLPAGTAPAPTLLNGPDRAKKLRLHKEAGSLLADQVCGT